MEKRATNLAWVRPWDRHLSDEGSDGGRGIVNWEPFGFMQNLLGSLGVELPTSKHNVVALMEYAITFSMRGDRIHLDRNGDVSPKKLPYREALEQFIRDRQLEGWGCRLANLQVVSFTVKQASEQLGLASERGAQGAIDRALDNHLLYKARNGTRGLASLYVIAPISWRHPWSNNIVVYSGDGLLDTY